MSVSRDPHTPDVVRSDAARVLSVSEAADFIDRHFAAHIEGITTSPLVAEREIRRWLSTGVWPCTRTADGQLGITVADLTAIWTPREEGGAR